jgi:hypothetical protein
MLAILALRGRRTVLFGATITGMLVILASWITVGTSGMAAYLVLLRYHHLEESWRMPNVRGLVESLHGSMTYIIIISLGLVVWCALAKIREPREEFCAALVTGTLVSYHMHVYDMTILLLPIMVLLERSLHWADWHVLILVGALIMILPQPLLYSFRLFYLLTVPVLGLLVLLTTHKTSPC